MSTSIYRGFRMKDMMVGELQELLRRFRSEAFPAAYGLLASHMSREAAELIDRAALGQPSPGADRPLATLWDKTSKQWRESKRERIRHPDIDIECEIAFTPAEGWLLGIVYTEQSELHKLWMEMSGAENFSWGDATDDLPEGVTQAEWDERERLWRIALPGFGAPMANGVSFTLLGEYLMPIDREKFVEAQPSLKERARHLAKYAVISEFTARPDKADGDTVEDHMEASFSAVNAAMRRMQTPEGKKRMGEVTAEIAAKLKPTLDLSDLMGWTPKPKDEAVPGVRP